VTDAKGAGETLVFIPHGAVSSKGPSLAACLNFKLAAQCLCRTPIQLPPALPHPATPAALDPWPRRKKTSQPQYGSYSPDGRGPPGKSLSGSRHGLRDLDRYGEVRLDLSSAALACFMLVDLDRPDRR
jgi:hypothetical protein